MIYNTLEDTDQSVIEAYKDFLKDKSFPCIAAKAALSKDQVQCLVVDHMGCPKDDPLILQALYDFVDAYRKSDEPYHTFAVLFRQPQAITETCFDEFMWQRLQSLRRLDSQQYSYDQRVDADPQSPNFSFSLKEEAFFIIGLHPASSRIARQFAYPALVFNPHAEFEKLRERDRYESMKMAVRKRDVILSGSENPMLKNFGEYSEVYQYSGKIYDSRWQCPLKSNHAPNKHNSTT